MNTASFSHSSRAARLGRIAAFLATGCAAVGGCGGDPATTEGDEPVNTAPLTLEDAEIQLQKIDGLMAREGATAGLVAQARLIRDRMEELNGLVDRIEIAPDHWLSFMRSGNGALVLAERGPAGKASALTGMDPTAMALDQIYARFAPGRQIPAALLSAKVSAGAAASPETEVVPGVGGESASSIRGPAATQAAGETAVVRSALTGSAADAATFRAGSCPTSVAGSTTVFPFCLLNWPGGAGAWATSDHTLVSLAPYSGGGSVSIRLFQGSTVRGTYSVIMGEWTNFWAIGPTIEVKDDPNCWFYLCTTHYEAKKVALRWEVFNAVGKAFHFGGRFYNKPRAFNTL